MLIEVRMQQRRALFEVRNILEKSRQTVQCIIQDLVIMLRVIRGN